MTNPNQVPQEEWMIDDIIHDLEALDFNSPEARSVVRRVLGQARKEGEQANKEIERLADFLMVNYQDQIKDGSAVDVAIAILKTKLESK